MAHRRPALLADTDLTGPVGHRGRGLLARRHCRAPDWTIETATTGSRSPAVRTTNTPMPAPVRAHGDATELAVVLGLLRPASITRIKCTLQRVAADRPKNPPDHGCRRH